LQQKTQQQVNNLHQQSKKTACSKQLVASGANNIALQKKACKQNNIQNCTNQKKLHGKLAKLPQSNLSHQKRFVSTLAFANCKAKDCKVNHLSFGNPFANACKKKKPPLHSEKKQKKLQISKTTKEQKQKMQIICKKLQFAIATNCNKVSTKHIFAKGRAKEQKKPSQMQKHKIFAANTIAQKKQKQSAKTCKPCKKICQKQSNKICNHTTNCKATKTSMHFAIARFIFHKRAAKQNIIAKAKHKTKQQPSLQHKKKCNVLCIAKFSKKTC